MYISGFAIVGLGQIISSPNLYGYQTTEVHNRGKGQGIGEEFEGCRKDGFAYEWREKAKGK